MSPFYLRDLRLIEGIADWGDAGRSAGRPPRDTRPGRPPPRRGLPAVAGRPRATRQAITAWRKDTGPGPTATALVRLLG